MAARKPYRSVVDAPASKPKGRLDTRGAQRGGARRFVRFAGSSLICTVLDQVIAGILFLALRRPLHDAGFLRILVSNVIARIFSQTLNYALNHRIVFAPKKGSVHENRHPSRRESLPRFFAVASLILALSTMGVYFLHTFFGIQESVAKMLMDTLLFFLNYLLQQRWVFRKGVRVNPKHLRR